MGMVIMSGLRTTAHCHDFQVAIHSALNSPVFGERVWARSNERTKIYSVPNLNNNILPSLMYLNCKFKCKVVTLHLNICYVDI